MAATHADRVQDALIETADMLMKLCDQAGVSKSPSEVRHEIASILNNTCSQSTVKRLRLRLRGGAVAR